MIKNCNCMHVEECTCPAPTSCPIYDILELDVEELELSKDRATSRKRHHDSVKAKNRSLETVAILSSKMDKLSNNATEEEVHKAISRANNAAKKSKKFKKQKEAQEQKAKPYRKCK